MNRIVFTFDDDLLRDATKHQRIVNTCTGVVYVDQLKVTIGRCIANLELIATVNEPEDMLREVEYLPL